MEKPISLQFRWMSLFSDRQLAFSLKEVFSFKACRRIHGLSFRNNRLMTVMIYTRSSNNIIITTSRPICLVKRLFTRSAEEQNRKPHRIEEWLWKLPRQFSARRTPGNWAVYSEVMYWSMLLARVLVFWESRSMRCGSITNIHERPLTLTHRHFRQNNDYIVKRTKVKRIDSVLQHHNEMLTDSQAQLTRRRVDKKGLDKDFRLHKWLETSTFILGDLTITKAP